MKWRLGLCLRWPKRLVCCRCNDNDVCLRWQCVKNNTTCVNCLPLKRSHCRNARPPDFTLPPATCVASNSETQLPSSMTLPSVTLATTSSETQLSHSQPHIPPRRYYARKLTYQHSTQRLCQYLLQLLNQFLYWGHWILSHLIWSFVKPMRRLFTGVTTFLLSRLDTLSNSLSLSLPASL